jgi:hypothetical protein
MKITQILNNNNIINSLQMIKNGFKIKVDNGGLITVSVP